MFYGVDKIHHTRKLEKKSEFANKNNILLAFITKKHFIAYEVGNF